MNEEKIRSQITEIEQELTEENDRADLHNDAGVGYSLLGEFDKAERYHKKAVELHRTPAHLFNLANIFSEQEKLEQSIDMYLQVLELNPAHIGALNNLADSYELNGQTDKAHELFHYITHIQPDEPMSHFNLGNFFLRQNQHIEAAKCYEAAIEKDENFTDAYFNIAWVLFQAKAYREALEYANLGLETDPNYSDLKQIKAKIEKELAE